VPVDIKVVQLHGLVERGGELVHRVGRGGRGRNEGESKGKQRTTAANSREPLLHRGESHGRGDAVARVPSTLKGLWLGSAVPRRPTPSPPSHYPVGHPRQPQRGSSPCERNYPPQAGGHFTTPLASLCAAVFIRGNVISDPGVRAPGSSWPQNPRKQP
jgi:hypothetical protein